MKRVWEIMYSSVYFENERGAACFMRAFLRLCVLGFAGMLLPACTPDSAAVPESVQGVQALDTRWASSPVIALDVTDQGMLRVAGLPGSGLIRTQNVQEERKVVLLGQSFVERYGMISTRWNLPPQTKGSLGDKPVIALVAGEAGAWIQRQPESSWLQDVRLLGDRLTRFEPKQEGRFKDRVLPFIESAVSSAAPSEGRVQVRAAAMSGRTPGLLLGERELRLLACLDGQSASPGPELAGAEAETLSCRVQWRSNGELKHPKLSAQVEAVHVRPSGAKPERQEGRAEASQLEGELRGLLKQLQAYGTDPLDIGSAVRSQYRGVWTPERWREAFAKADIQVTVITRYSDSAA